MYGARRFIGIATGVVIATLIWGARSLVPTLSLAQGDARPDAQLTPGAVVPGVTAAQVCTPGYSSSVRPRGEAWYRLRREVFRRYGIGPHQHYGLVIDHLVPLEAGGAPDSVENLWPQPREQARVKDAAEDALHVELCDGRISIQDAQRRILNWPHALDGIPLTPAEARRVRRMTEGTGY